MLVLPCRQIVRFVKYLKSTYSEVQNSEFVSSMMLWVHAIKELVLKLETPGSLPHQGP